MLTIRAYAKINIGLRILNKRTDGYHNLETVFTRINLFDGIIFEESNDIVLKTNIRGLPSGKNNFCTQAATMLKEQCGVAKGVRIFLNKLIPLGSGLGGGSSDAAAVLSYLPKFWGIEVTKEKLNSIAINIGSDVPYFLEQGAAYATGRGEKLEYFKLDIPYWILLIYPNVSVSTAWAYQNLKMKSNKNDRSLKDLIQDYIHLPNKLDEYIKNDFETLVFEKYPQVKKLKLSLFESGADFVQMSGSGSSVYAFYKDEHAAKTSELEFSKDYKAFLTQPNFNPPI
jgi:4-diphosphocytidyl-2-C-methyl-D-erythritol kinase